MHRPIVVLSIYGGMLQDVFSSDPTVRAVLVDWDSEGRAADEPHVVEISDSLGRASLAYVAEYSASPLERLSGDVAEALKASDFDGNCELAAAVSQLLGNGQRDVASKPADRTAVAATTAPSAELFQRLIAWYDAEDGDDDELERIVTAARYEVQRLK